MLPQQDHAYVTHSCPAHYTATYAALRTHTAGLVVIAESALLQGMLPAVREHSSCSRAAHGSHVTGFVRSWLC